MRIQRDGGLIMCGIAGVLDFSRSSPEQQLLSTARLMTDQLSHRGPDGDGYWADERAGVALGHRRLSIIDVSPSGAQPMTSPWGRFVLTFNGEIYNYRSLRDQLVRTGVRFRGTSDTEVLAAGIEEWGFEQALDRVDGMFAFAVWDRQEQELLLARDRFGEKPLYFGGIRSKFFFGSELRAIASVAGPLEIDPAAVADVVAHKCVQGDRTIYREFAKLEPGHFAVVGIDGRVRRSAYWSPLTVALNAMQRPYRGGELDAADELEELLARAVSSRMVADVPVGAFLSGGVDSAGIVAFMRDAASQAVRTYTVGLDDPRFDESEAATAVAERLGTDHTTLQVTSREAVDHVPRLALMYDEPFADSSMLPTHLVSALAVKDVKVALTGDGGDEVFGGYNRHVFGDRIARGHRLLPGAARRRLGKSLIEANPAMIERRFSQLSPLLPSRLHVRLPADKARKLGRLLSAEGDRGIYRSLVTDVAADRFMTVPSYVSRESVVWGLDGQLNFGRKAMLADTQDYLSSDVLVKVDRAAMAVSLETRAPFLSPDLFAWSWRLPQEYRASGGVGKRVLRAAVATRIDRSGLGVVKSGFGVPVGEWLRGPLRSWAGDALASSVGPIAPLLRTEEINALWTDHLAGRRDHTDVLWSLVMLKSWSTETSPRLSP